MVTHHLRPPGRLAMFDGTAASSGGGYWGSPDTWIHDSGLPSEYHIFPFDYFVEWGRNALGHEVWIKRFISKDDANAAFRTPSIITNALAGEQHVLHALVNHLAPLDVDVAVVVIPDYPKASDWAQRTGSNLAVAHVPITSSGGSGVPEWWSLDRLRAEIDGRRGQPFRIGGKGLTWSTSALEKYLSTTTSMWPGDCDGLLDSSGALRAVIEWKKHTIPGPVAAYTFERYYRNADAKKWDALAVLAAACGQLPIIGVNWPNKDTSDHVVLERIEGAPGKLAVIERRQVDLIPGKCQPAVISALVDLT